MRRVKAALADNGPVMILALIAAVGSFDHISKLAAEYGQKEWRAWAVAVCIDLMCVMAARERQRDKRLRRRPHGIVSWPTLVLTGGITLTLAANLAGADPSPWGWIVAGTPAGAFLIAVSMLERRAAHTHNEQPAVDSLDGAGCADAVEGEVVATREPRTPAGPALDHTPAELPADDAPAQLVAGAALGDPGPALPDALLEDARYIAEEHARLYGGSISAEQLGKRLRLPPETAHHLLTRITTRS